MHYTYPWDQPEHIQAFNSSMADIYRDIAKLQTTMDRKQAFLDAMISASKVEEALFAATGEVE